MFICMWPLGPHWHVEQYTDPPPAKATTHIILLLLFQPPPYVCLDQKENKDSGSQCSGVTAYSILSCRGPLSMFWRFRSRAD